MNLNGHQSTIVFSPQLDLEYFEKDKVQTIWGKAGGRAIHVLF